MSGIHIPVEQWPYDIKISKKRKPRKTKSQTIAEAVAESMTKKNESEILHEDYVFFKDYTV